MNAKQFSRLLNKLNIKNCEGRKWVKGKSLKEAYDTCPRADWMLEVLEKMADKPGWATSKQIMLIRYEFVKKIALPIWNKYYPNDKHLYIANEAFKKYANGEINKKTLNIALNAAMDAARDATNIATSNAARAAVSLAAWVISNLAISTITRAVVTNVAIAIWTTTWDKIHKKIIKIIKKHIGKLKILKERDKK